MTAPVVPRVLLIGMMGAGKTTLGAALADRLGWSYLDSDAEIVRRVGATVPAIWQAQGEEAFRRRESEALGDAAASAGPVVVAVAGGALLDVANRAVVQGAGLVVWLRADVATLAERVGSGEGRPLLEGDAGAALARLYGQRRPLYEEAADVVIDVDGRSPAALVDLIVEALARRGLAGGLPADA